MAQIAKIEASVQTKCSADKVYDIFKNNMAKLVEFAPKHFQGVELLEGEEGCAGNVKLVKYTLRGPETCKLRIISIDDGAKAIDMEVLEGQIAQFYKSFKCTIAAIDSNTVKWSVEFEKANESAPAPDHYIRMATQVTNLIDAHLVN